MRDITKDLEERLEAKRREKQRYLKLAEEADADSIHIAKMLEQEKARLRNPLEDAVALLAKRPTPRLPIEEFIVHTLASEGPKTKEELREAADAAGYFKQGEAGGRVIHAHVLNLMKALKIKVYSTGMVAMMEHNYQKEPQPAAS